MSSVQRYYQRNAARYDLLMLPFAQIRSRAIAELRLHAGASVLELGCGTGTSFAALRRTIGARGRLIGLDSSATMLQHAQRRITQSGWRNVSLIQADAAALPLSVRDLDAVLVFYSNDVIVNPAAIDRLLAVLRPGGRVVIAGARLCTGPHGVLLNPLTRGYARNGMHSQLMTQPWDHLAQRAPLRYLETYLIGSAFVAVSQYADGEPGT